MWTALERIRARLHLKRAVRVAATLLGFVLVMLISWQLLRWFDGQLPAASALVVLFAVLALIVLLFLLLQTLLTGTGGLERAAIEADRRTGLKNELQSAFWFAREQDRSGWISAQLQRAARTAGTLEPVRVVSVHLPRTGTAALIAGLVALALIALAPPLVGSAGGQVGTGTSSTHTQALREMVAALPDSELTRQLESALQTLERADASPQERQQAMAQAQAAVERMGLEAAAMRDQLYELGEALGNQPGLEKVAEALAQGDAGRAAQLLAQIEKQNQPAQSAEGASPGAEPVDAGAQEPSLEQALLEATQATGRQESAPSREAVQAAMDRLNEIARQLAAANYANEAWQSVPGAQVQGDQMGELTMGRHARETSAGSTPSPGAGETRMGGGSMSQSTTVAQGQARSEQEGGTRMGEGLSSTPADPVLGLSAERLEAQLKQSALTGEAADGEAEEDESWYYSESQQQKSMISRREVQARMRFAQAEAGSNGGISIQHRQIVKDYFMNLREGAQ